MSNCPHCGAPDLAESAELDRMMYATAYRAGWTDAAGQGPAHPAVVDSVARMFGDWPGIEHARSTSVTHFRDWYANTRTAEEVDTRAYAA